MRLPNFELWNPRTPLKGSSRPTCVYLPLFSLITCIHHSDISNLAFVFICKALCKIRSGKVKCTLTAQIKLVGGKCHLNCGVDWVRCVRSAPQSDEMDGGTAAGRLAGGTGGTGCLENGGSSPTGRRNTEERVTSLTLWPCLLVHHSNYIYNSRDFKNTKVYSHISCSQKSRLNLQDHISLCQYHRCYVSDVSFYLQSQLIAGVSAIHLRAGQAEPPLKASWAFSQPVADWAEDVLVHRDGFSTWRTKQRQEVNTETVPVERRRRDNLSVATYWQ